jgi:hypothetical protein
LDGVRFDPGYYLDLEQRLRSLLAEVAGLLPAEDADQVAEFLDHGEYGLALETLADALTAQGRPVPRLAFASITGLVETMGMDDRSVRMLRPLAVDRGHPS